MTLGDRCDDIVRLIDEGLRSVGAETTDVVDTSSHPAGSARAGRGPRPHEMSAALELVVPLELVTPLEAADPLEMARPRDSGRPVEMVSRRRSRPDSRL